MVHLLLRDWQQRLLMRHDCMYLLWLQYFDSTGDSLLLLAVLEPLELPGCILQAVTAVFLQGGPPISVLQGCWLKIQ
jgi:hypothetical protein